MNLNIGVGWTKSVTRACFAFLLISVFILLGCENSGDPSKEISEKPETGFFSCTLTWPTNIDPVENKTNTTRSLNCDGIDSIVFTFYDDSDMILKQPDAFNCGMHFGRVDGLTPGDNYRVVITATDLYGAILYGGEYSGFSIVAGQTASPPGGEISMEACTDADSDSFYSISVCGTAVDCNDSDPNEHPDQTWYQDADVDGYSDGTLNTISCVRPTSYYTASELVSVSGDCNDSDPAEHPGQVWYQDADVDGYSDGTMNTTSCVRPTSYYTASELIAVSGDCNDADGDINPGETEDCIDDKDNDCNGATDCVDPVCFGNVLCYENYTNSVSMTFNRIEPGTFTMGSPDGLSEYPLGSGEIAPVEIGRDEDETPYQVTLTQPFYMQTTEVTQGQWEMLMGSNPSFFISCGIDCPVENISWNDVQTFLLTLNSRGEGTYRLPTEAEWEYAARADTTTAFFNGDITSYADMTTCNFDLNLDAMGWYCFNSGEVTSSVAQKNANAWGLYDMHGNVNEWCQDIYGVYPTNSAIDPTGLKSGFERVNRGGDSWNRAWKSRSAERGKSSPEEKSQYNGFRLIYEPSFTNNLGMTFNKIKAGSFTMGSPTAELGHEPDETEHEVTLTQDYYIQTTEVTQGQWEAVMGSNPSYFSSCGSECPVERVSWDDVQLFIASLNSRGEGTYRLPTEAEWEYAARSGGSTALANGDISVTDCSFDSKLDAMAWYCYNDGSVTHPVSQKQNNTWGLSDMYGNVHEWCQDWYGDYPLISDIDPVGPQTGDQKYCEGDAITPIPKTVAPHLDTTE